MTLCRPRVVGEPVSLTLYKQADTARVIRVSGRRSYHVSKLMLSTLARESGCEYVWVTRPGVSRVELRCGPVRHRGIKRSQYHDVK